MARPARGRETRRGRQIYVETLIDARGPHAVDEVWRLTQDPAQHPRWDLRFTHIVPTHRSPQGQQHFRYEVRAPGALGALGARVGLGLHGTGISVGERRDAAGRGTSALRFAPASALSPLGAGSGYWRYDPTPDGLRFLTGYDYAPGWGPIGPLLDPWLVRPLVGWATAWSFDRLRLQVDGADPARARDLAVAVAAGRVAGVLAGAGLVARAVRPGGRGPRSAGLRAASAAVGIALVVAATLLPPPASVPSARRTRRTPPDARSAQAPRSLSTLARPTGGPR